jgi:hypothetical protein
MTVPECEGQRSWKDVGRSAETLGQAGRARIRRRSRQCQTILATPTAWPLFRRSVVAAFERSLTHQARAWILLWLWLQSGFAPTASSEESADRELTVGSAYPRPRYK